MKKLLSIALLYINVCSAQNESSPPTPEELGYHCVRPELLYNFEKPFPVCMYVCDTTKTLFVKDKNGWSPLTFSKEVILKGEILQDDHDGTQILVRAFCTLTKEEVWYQVFIREENHEVDFAAKK